MPEPLRTTTATTPRLRGNLLRGGGSSTKSGGGGGLRRLRPPGTPVMMRRYFSRHRSDSSRHEHKKLFIDSDAGDFVGMYSRWAVLWFIVKLLVPTAYLYIFMVLVRELFPQQLLWLGQVLNDHIHFPVLHQWTLASTISRIMVTTTTTMMAASGMQDDASDAGDGSATPGLAEDGEMGGGVGVGEMTTTTITTWINNTPRSGFWFWIELWCYLEALFYIGLRIHIRWLQCQDPLEASLSSAPLMELSDRAILFHRMMTTEQDDPVAFLLGWFFDTNDVSEIGVYDVRDFIAWSMYEGRHQEHLTSSELEQLEGFVRELQIRISLQLYGASDDLAEDEETLVNDDDDDVASTSSWENIVSSGIGEEHDAGTISTRDILRECSRLQLPRPKKVFHFRAEPHPEEANFFTDLYEAYRRRYDQIDFNPVQDLRNMVQRAAGDNFKPVQQMQTLVAETAQHFAEVEETARTTASQTAAHMYESLVPSGSMMDKQLSAMGHATYSQLQDAWNSVKSINQRLETARFLSKQRQRLRQQLKGYRVMLNKMREMSSGVPSKQMVAMMRRITECYEAMESLEGRAQAGFVQATGFALKNVPFMQKKEPQRFAKYSADPILGVKTYPLCFHLLLLGLTEIPLRRKLHKLGFERKRVGSVSYYYHPGRFASEDDDDVLEDDNNRTPIVFVHGIGIGLISYVTLIEKFLDSGRAIFLPEIPYVCGFRPWQSPKAVLQPAVVGSTMTAMLATHGHVSASWVGHSFGTSWLSYMVKFFPDAVASVLFLDPVCFCLHWPRLTKQFVYQRPDPGTISYIIRTDVVVNWTIQRSFPWAWIALFAEQIRVPCEIYLSEKDALVPAEKVKKYLRSLDFPCRDFETVRQELLQRQGVDDDNRSSEEDMGFTATSSCNDDDDDSSSVAPTIHCTVFRGHGHGEWTEDLDGTAPAIAHTVEVLCQRAAHAKSR